MNKYFTWGLVALAVVCVGGWAIANKPQLGGDFAGGQVPSNLWTGSAATNSVSPITSNVFIPGAVSAGGVGANNQVTIVYTAVTTYPWTPSSTGGILLGPVSATTSTTSTVLAFNATGFAVGDACEVAFNGTTSSLPFGADAFVTSVATATNAVSATVTFWNGANQIIGFNNTSTGSGVTSTLKTTCFHTGV